MLFLRVRLEKLPDVPKTVDCVTEHVKGMADRTDLWNAVMYFAIRQYVDNYEEYWILQRE